VRSCSAQESLEIARLFGHVLETLGGRQRESLPDESSIDSLAEQRLDL
jgi:hypothetical protein